MSSRLGPPRVVALIMRGVRSMPKPRIANQHKRRTHIEKRSIRLGDASAHQGNGKTAGGAKHDGVSTDRFLKRHSTAEEAFTGMLSKPDLDERLTIFITALEGLRLTTQEVIKLVYQPQERAHIEHHTRLPMRGVVQD